MKENFYELARREKRAIGAFNVNSHDEMIAIANVAQELDMPVIMMASMSCARFMGVKHFAEFVRQLNEEYTVSIYSHLDHCTDPELLRSCVDAGFNSVMFDGSPLEHEENIRLTTELAEYAHSKGVFIEGEIGVIAGEEGPVKSAVSKFTDPDAAKNFVEKTKVDTLAVSIGNAHGFYKEEPKLQFELLADIAAKCPVPLVLHGGTGIPNEDIRKAITYGMVKVNVGTELRKSFVDALYSYTRENEKGDIRPFLKTVHASVGAVAKKYMVNYNTGLAE